MEAKSTSATTENLDLEALLLGLERAKDNLHAYVGVEELPESICFAEAYYDVAKAFALLDDLEVFAAVEAVLNRRKVALAPQQQPEPELVGEPL
jgi:hypothetical protein